MKDKIMSQTEVVITLKRSELLLEELIYQLILSNSENNDEANEKFKISMSNVTNSFKKFFEELPESN
jgi:hypothetical protein